MGIIPFDKFSRLVRIIKANGGISGSLSKLWRMDTLKEGTLVGIDSWGHKYYENYYYMIGRSRWVEYNPTIKFEYDGSQVTAEWFGWLHYKTDKLPTEDPAKHALSCCCWAHCWLQPHAENETGTDRAYYPYTSTVSHIKPWDGCTVCDKMKGFNACES